jgi:hypothetical protein
MRFSTSGGASGRGSQTDSAAATDESTRPEHTSPVAEPASPATPATSSTSAALPPSASQAGRGPWFGWLGRTLLLLYPESPAGESRSRQDKARIAFGTFALILAAAAIQLLRQGGTPPWTSLYAEDSKIFLPRGIQAPVGSLFREYAGYLELVPQLIGDLAGRVPLLAAPAVFAVGGALISAGMAVFVYHASSGYISSRWLRVLLGCSVILLAPSLLEVANNGVNCSWYLMFGLFWALLWRPRSVGGMALAAVIAFAAMASNFVALLFLPMAVTRVLALPRLREQAVTFGWLAGIAFQVPGLIESSEPSTLAPLPAGFHFYGQHVMVPVVFGWTLAKEVQNAIGIPATIAIATLVVAAAVAWVVWRGNPQVRVFAAMTVIMSLVLTIIPALIRGWVATGLSSADWVPGSRYATDGILLIEGILIVGVGIFLRGRTIRLDQAARAVAVVLVVGLAVGWATSYRYVNVRTGNTWTTSNARVWACQKLHEDLWQHPSVAGSWWQKRHECVPASKTSV